mgnify:CR=1 FL=1
MNEQMYICMNICINGCLNENACIVVYKCMCMIEWMFVFSYECG